MSQAGHCGVTSENSRHPGGRPVGRSASHLAGIRGDYEWVPALGAGRP